MRRLSYLAVLFTLVLTSFASARADDLPDSAQMLEIAKGWMQQIDSGAYEATYNEGDPAFREKVTNQKWALVLKTIREPLGKIVSRHLLTNTYKPNGFEGTNGEFIVITYKTSFSKGGDYTETVVLRRDDGKWRGAGYAAVPTPPSAQ